MVGQLRTVTTTRSLVDDQKAAAYPGDTRSRDLALSLSPIFLRAHNLDDVYGSTWLTGWARHRDRTAKDAARVVIGRAAASDLRRISSCVRVRAACVLVYRTGVKILGTGARRGGTPCAERDSE
jgi:hypothetical protein